MSYEEEEPEDLIYANQCGRGDARKGLPPDPDMEAGSCEGNAYLNGYRNEKQTKGKGK